MPNRQLSMIKTEKKYLSKLLVPPEENLLVNLMSSIRSELRNIAEMEIKFYVKTTAAVGGETVRMNDNFLLLSAEQKKSMVAAV